MVEKFLPPAGLELMTARFITARTVGQCLIH